MIRLRTIALAVPLTFAAALAAAAEPLLPAAAVEPAAAQDQDGGHQSPKGEEITVAARRVRRDYEIGSSVSVIDAADLAQRQYSYVADALRDSAGVTIARNGAGGGFASARIRGAAGGQTLVVIDGVVVNDPAAPQGGYNFANLDVADIERIEVLRGPQSVIYGADAIGGVISIRTTGAGAGAVSGFIEGGSLGAVRGGVTLLADRGEAFLRASVSGTRTGGVSRADGGSEPDGYRSIAASLRAASPLANGWTLEGTARFSDSSADIDGFPPPAFALGDTLETEDTEDYAVAGVLKHGDDRGNEGLSGAFTLSYGAIDRRNEDQGAETFSAKGDRLTADYIASAQLGRGVRLVGGTEIESASAEVSGIDESARSAAAFALLEVEPIERLILSAGGRRDEFSNFEGATTARVAAAYSGARNWIFRASWGEGFRAPSLFELNFDQFGVTPNPNLRPERATGFDIGVERRWGAPSDPWLTTRAAYFETRIRDQIDFDFLGAGYFNIDSTRARGVEAEIDLRPSKNVSASLAYGFTDAVDLTTGADLIRIPRHKGTLAFSWSPTSALEISSSLIANGRETDSPTANDAFLRLDLRAAWSVSDAVQIYGRIENATDTDYQDVSGYGEPGAAAYGGVRVRL